MMTDMSVTSSSHRDRRIRTIGGGQSDVKERLVSAAAEVFAGSSYQASRVSDIVGVAGVAQGTFYLYFENKEALLLELVDRFCTGILAETLGTKDPCETHTTEDVVAQVRSMWRTIVVRCREQPNLVRAVLGESRGFTPAVRDLMRGIDEQVANGVAAYVAVAVERGLARPVEPRLAGWLVQGLVYQAMSYAIDIDPGAEAEWLADQLTTIECGGLLRCWDDAWLADGSARGGLP